MSILARLFKRRETPAERAAWIENTVATVAQRAHNASIASLRQASRSFEAAETPAWTESWPTHAAPINDDLARQLPTLRARARGLARNNEWAINYLAKLDDNVLGAQGIVLQMRAKRGEKDGQLDAAANALLEQAWARWCKCADVSGATWREVETLALASLPQDGELLYRLRPGAGPMGFQIQLLPADLLDVNVNREYGGRRVRLGVEIDDDGKPLFYWLRASKVGEMAPELTTVGKHVRVPASEIRHCFLKREIGQLRGYPWLAGGARRLWMLHDFEESAAVASTNAAKRQGFFVSENGDAPPAFDSERIVADALKQAASEGRTLSAEEIATIKAAAERYTTTVPGQYDTLPQGYDFRPYESKWPDVSADGYVKQQLRGWAAARGLSYCTLGNDLSDVNYSSARVGILDDREHYKSIQAKLIGWLHAEVFAAALPYLVLHTRGLSPSRIDEYRAAATWQGRRWKGIDPVKEANADEANLRNKLTSRRRIILERGDDPDEVAAEIEAEEKRYGVPAPAPQPGKPGKTDDEEDDEK